MKLAIFLSGRGSNFQAILQAIDDGMLRAEVALVISNIEEAGGLKIARDRNIPTRVFDRARYTSGSDFGRDMLEALQSHQVEFIALAGYLRMIPPVVIRAYPSRIVNIHPALLPKFGGKGMFGHHVHEAVIGAGESESGATVHFVDEIYDNGAIIEQRKVPVLPGDTPEQLAERVLQIEHQLLPEVIARLVNQDIQE